MYVGRLGTGQTDALSMLSSIKATNDTDDTQDSTSTSSASSTSAASVDVSGPGKLYAKLEELQKEDPTKFKEVVSDIAKKLKSAADQSGDKHLSELASKFQDVANGGDLSEIKPPSPPQQNGANGVAAAYSQSGQASGTPPSGPPPDGAGGTRASADTMKSLFSSINDEIDSALSGITSTQSS